MSPRDYVGKKNELERRLLKNTGLFEKPTKKRRRPKRRPRECHGFSGRGRNENKKKRYQKILVFIDEGALREYRERRPKNPFDLILAD